MAKLSPKQLDVLAKMAAGWILAKVRERTRNGDAFTGSEWFSLTPVSNVGTIRPHKMTCLMLVHRGLVATDKVIGGTTYYKLTDAGWKTLVE